MRERALTRVPPDQRRWRCTTGFGTWQFFISWWRWTAVVGLIWRGDGRVRDKRWGDVAGDCSGVWALYSKQFSPLWAAR